MLDVGCGTGVLAIVGALLGASVRAIDVSEAAIEATRANAVANGVGDRIFADRATVADVAAADGAFDLVVANILAPTLVSIGPDRGRLTAPSGRLVVSGVLAGLHDHVVDALAPMVVVDTAYREGWAAVTLRHD
jgi:ribosomal protein L11 methyltransferase